MGSAATDVESSSDWSSANITAGPAVKYFATSAAARSALSLDSGSKRRFEFVTPVLKNMEGRNFN